jgi:hypothetical protein
MATKPDPAYFLSSSTTNYFGTHTANISAYAMPVGYGYQAYGRAYESYSGTGYTQYYYTDANAFARSMHNLRAATHRPKQHLTARVDSKYSLSYKGELREGLRKRRY